MKKTINIAIAVIQRRVKQCVPDSKIEFLVAWRDKNKHQGDCYEFVGGKIEPVETAFQGLVRECSEEIGITVHTAFLLKKITHDYGDKLVCLHVFLVQNFIGLPSGREGQTVKWITADALMHLPMPKANDVIKRLLCLKTVYIISKSVADFTDMQSWLTYYAEKLPKSTQFYVRDKQLSFADYVVLIEKLKQLRKDLRIIALYRFHDAFLSIRKTNLIDGFHLSHEQILMTKVLPRLEGKLYLGACHDKKSVFHAEQLGIDGVTISPVYPTPTHVNVKGIGWQRFNEWSQIANMPCYALGGVGLIDGKKARDNGAFGVAGIRLLEKIDKKLFTEQLATFGL